jgi:hypothetical protein
VSYRRVDDDVPPTILFTYGIRFLDGRGDTVEERLEVIAVDADGVAGADAETARRLFLVAEQRGAVNTSQERSLTSVVRDAFDSLKAVGDQCAVERARLRLTDIEKEQRRIGDAALVRVGVWKERAEARVEERLGTQMALAIDPTERRRRTVYERQLVQITERAQQRHHDIQRMRECRIESVDSIGALVLLPPGGWLGAA